jgi:hypothetical protein
VPKPAEPGIAAFVTAGTRQVLGIIGDLHDTHAQFLEKLDIADLIPLPDQSQRSGALDRRDPL